MKRINAYLATIILLFSIQTTHGVAEYTENTPPTRKNTTQSMSNWFSYFTTPLVSFTNSITTTFSAIKNYFFPVVIQQPKEQPIVDNEHQANEPVQPEKESLQKKIVAEEKKPEMIPTIPSSIKKQAEKIAASQLPILGISYNCAEKRLDLIFENAEPRYFNYIDSYQYSPQKKYILATKIDTSFGQLVFTGALKKTSTTLINPLSNQKEIATLKNIKMYDFSPQETKLLFLTSDTSIWQTFGITKPSTKHEEPTGILKKTSDIFTYHIFDFKTQKIINSFENATSVSFNNEDEVTVFFENKTIEVHKLNTTLFTSLTKNLSGPSTQQGQEFYRYFPHENRLELPLTNPQATFSDSDKFHFSPQKKYVLLEQNPISNKAVNLIKGINPNLPLIKLVNMQTGKAISNFGASDMLMNDTTNIITYEFSPQETKILLQTRGQYGCKYILFDIEQNSVINQPIASAQSVHFKNEYEFTIITAQGKTNDIPINVQTRKEKLLQNIANAIGPENIQKITAFSSGFSELTKQVPKEKQKTIPFSELEPDLQDFFNSLPEETQEKHEKIQKTIPFSELDQDSQEFLNSLPEEPKAIKNTQDEEEKEEMFFDSVVEESMYLFKTYATMNKSKAQNAITDIITELSTQEEDNDTDKQSIVIETYKNYSPDLQKLFINDLLQQYKTCSQEIKEKFITTLFAAPNGTIYKPKDKQKIEIKNKANTVTATIRIDKIDNQNREVLIFTSNDPIELLSTHILEKNMRTMIFNPSGTILAVSYEKQPTNTSAPLDMFIQTNNQQYKPKDFSINDSPEIIGLLFLDESTLLLLDEQYTITPMAISDDTKKFQQALILLKKIETDCIEMESADINSPAIYSDIYDNILRLEYISEKLSNEHKAIINKKQAQLEDTYKLTFTAAIKNILTTNWNSHKNTIETIAMNLVKPALSVAILHILQAATGNTQLNIEALKIPIMSGVAATFAVEYGKYILNPSLVSAITGAGSVAITEQLIPYNKTVTIPTMTPSGILRGAFTASMATEVQLIIAQEGGVQKLIQEYSRDFLLREKKSSSESENEITSLLFSTIKSTLRNDQVASLLTEVTYVTIESACIGMGLYFAGLGFAHEKPLTEALYYNALRGVVQGTINYGFTTTSNKTGAIITIPTTMISASIVSGLTHQTFTTQSAASALIHATTQAVADVIINDSERVTGILSQAKQKIEQSIRNSWSKAYDLFSTFKENAFTVQDVEEKDIAYGSV